ncbi:MAG TPA: molecular chaperone DnaJ [Bryobacteraceae bacterium]|nr:molecular chaperone DnaJ [Bryobacteraceae bacterium]
MNVAKRDYYEVLGVDRAVDEVTLKGAYRKLALQYHPDRNPNNHEAEEKFKEAAEAYSILSDGQKRAAYDRYGHAGVQSAAAGGGGFDPGQFTGFEDILGEFFGFGDLFGGAGGRRGRTRAQRGEDLPFELEVSFEDMMKGMSADIQVPKMEACGRCSGKGAEPEDGLTQCPVCRGKGEIHYQQSFLTVRRTCSQCNGRGQIIRRPCKECKGDGYLRKDKKLKINIPAGVDTGTRLRLTGEGQPGVNGGPAGDLYVLLKVKEHPIFDRIDDDLHCTVPVNVAQAVLGTEVDIQTFDGLQSVKIPEGSQKGSKIKLKGLGVPNLQGRGRGDMYINIDVKIPTKLSREQRKLFEQLRETLPEENEPHEKSLLDKVKDYFM